MSERGSLIPEISGGEITFQFLVVADFDKKTDRQLRVAFPVYYFGPAYLCIFFVVYLGSINRLTYNNEIVNPERIPEVGIYIYCFLVQTGDIRRRVFTTCMLRNINADLKKKDGNLNLDVILLRNETRRPPANVHRAVTLICM